MNKSNVNNLNKSKRELLAVKDALDKYDSEVESNFKNNPLEYSSEYSLDDSFVNLYEESVKEAKFKTGDIVTGTIVEVLQDKVLVDINFKSEGYIPINEFRLIEGTVDIKPGDKVDVYIEKIENENGMVGLSKDKADMFRAWNDISKAAENEDIIEGTVIGKVKGGLSVDIGVKAFLPGSQIDLRPVRNLDIYLGKKYKFKVIKFNKKRGNIVLSRRSILEQERETLKSQATDVMKEGAEVVGIIKNITDYGAFLDLGGIDGLLHITDMSWGRVKHPSELFNVGDEIKVKVLKYDADKQRVSLGLKQLHPDPWEIVKEKYPPGSKLNGKIVNIADYGAFIELGEGIEGLIHISEMSWTKRIKNPSQMVKIGDSVEVVVLDVDSNSRRISLGMKQLQTNPWVELKSTYAPGTVIEGEVKSVTDFGVFVGIEDGIDGLVHISDFSWNKRINHPSEIYKKGEKIRAVVLGVDIDNERFSLGVKQLETDPWANVESKYEVGSRHKVKVKKIADFGVFVELEPEIEGLIHISELTTERISKPEDFCSLEDILEAEVISIDKDSRKIGLSCKVIKLSENKDLKEKSSSKKETSKTSLGDIFSMKLKENEENTDK